MTAPPTLETQAPLPPLDSTGLLRWAWRQLTSMRTALILLFALAVASIPGSILPQRGNNPLLVDEWLEEQPTIGPILDRLGFFDVFGAPWFAAVYLLLFISLIGCVLPRVGVHWRAMRSQPPGLSTSTQWRSTCGASQKGMCSSTWLARISSAVLDAKGSERTSCPSAASMGV